MASAKAIAASLPDWTTIPRRISSTVTRELTSMNIFEPPLRHAFSLTVTVSSRRRVSSFNARKARKAVIILVIEAGGVRRSASFSKSTAPVSKSIKIASRAGVSSAVAGRAMAIARPIAMITKNRAAMSVPLNPVAARISKAPPNHRPTLDQNYGANL